MFEEMKKGFGKAVGQTIGHVVGTLLVGAALAYLSKGKTNSTEKTETK